MRDWKLMVGALLGCARAPMYLLVQPNDYLAVRFLVIGALAFNVLPDPGRWVIGDNARPEYSSTPSSSAPHEGRGTRLIQVDPPRRIFTLLKSLQVPLAARLGFPEEVVVFPS